MQMPCDGSHLWPTGTARLLAHLVRSQLPARLWRFSRDAFEHLTADAVGAPAASALSVLFARELRILEIRCAREVPRGGPGASHARAGSCELEKVTCHTQWVHGPPLADSHSALLILPEEDPQAQ